MDYSNVQSVFFMIFLRTENVAECSGTLRFFFSVKTALLTERIQGAFFIF